MKLCYKCDIKKEEIAFSWRNKTKQTRMPWCKSCIKEYDSNRQKSQIYLARKYELAKERQEKSRNYIQDVLQNSKCMDCENDNWRVLEFDHKDKSTKLYNISMMYDLSTETIQKEIDKCEIRCANCHRIRTAKQFNTWRFKRDMV